MREAKENSMRSGCWSVAVALVLAGVAFAAFTGYVAYCGMHKFSLEAFERPPREDAAHLGSVLEAGLSWTMRVCGVLVTILGAALAVRRSTLGQAFSSVVVLLAGVVLISQHWAASIPLGVGLVAFVVGTALRRRPPGQGREGRAAGGAGRDMRDQRNWLQRLARSRRNRVLGGVCGGLGEQTALPGWCWRLLFCLAMLLYGIGAVGYVVLWVLVPREPQTAEPPAPAVQRLD
jgi:phage shock protein PspC (stress-responsive transcriptional regulator)